MPTAMTDQEFLRACADMGSDRLDGYSLYQDYYDGEHRSQLTERQKTYLQAAGFPFAENFCETVVDLMVERMSVVGFDCGDNAALAEWCDDLWQRRKLDTVQGTVHNQAAIKGDAFVVVDVGPDLRPRVTWNPSHKVKVVYSSDGDEAEYAVKVWTTKTRSAANPAGKPIARMNIYWPDRIERWFSVVSEGDAGDASRNWWIPFAGDGEPWPVPWIDATGAPIGIPVIHFANRPKGRRYGVSELRGVIPQQDALNKQCLDLFDVLDHQGWPQRWATGINRETSELTLAVGEMIWSASDTTKFGQFDPANPSGLLEAIEATLRRIAARSRSPMHLMLAGGNLPSGETLKTAESPLVKKIEDREGPLGDGHESVMAMSAKVDQVFGRGEAPYDPENDTITTRWENPESRNELEEVQVQEAEHRLGVSRDTILRKRGYDPDEERELREGEQDDQRKQDESFARMFDAGQLTEA